MTIYEALPKSIHNLAVPEIRGVGFQIFNRTFKYTSQADRLAARNDAEAWALERLRVLEIQKGSPLNTREKIAGALSDPKPVEDGPRAAQVQKKRDFTVSPYQGRLEFLKNKTLYTQLDKSRNDRLIAQYEKLHNDWLVEREAVVIATQNKVNREADPEIARARAHAAERLAAAEISDKATAAEVRTLRTLKTFIDGETSTASDYWKSTGTYNAPATEPVDAGSPPLND